MKPNLQNSFLRSVRFVTLAGLITTTIAGSNAHADDDTRPVMRVLHTPAKTRFGIFGEKPSAPAPTLFVFAISIGDMGKRLVYTEAGKYLARDGWLYVTLDPPCHGHDRDKDEPPNLVGWAHRVKNGTHLTEPFVERCVDVLDYLVQQGYTDPKRVAASGTSRGGFCALHFAAAEPRVRAVAGVSPVTNLLALREFEGVTEEQVRNLNISRLAGKLADRAVWLSIGDNDQRVGTDDCTAAARQLSEDPRRRQAGAGAAPVELIVEPSEGHHPVKDAYARAARFILEQTANDERADARHPPPVGRKQQLFVDNYVIEGMRGVTIEILDAEDNPISGFCGDDAAAHESVDQLRLSPRWNDDVDLSALPGTVARVKLRLEDVRLYAFQIR